MKDTKTVTVCDLANMRERERSPIQVKMKETKTGTVCDLANMTERERGHQFN